MTLWEIKAKDNAQIDSICSTLSPAVAGRLTEMGFTEGQTVYCLRRSPLKGPLVIQLGDSVYSLEQAIANKVSLRQAS